MGLAGGFSCNRAEAEKPWKGNAREAESVRLCEGIEQKYVPVGRGPCWRPKLETI